MLGFKTTQNTLYAFNTASRLWKGNQLHSAETMFQQNIMKYKQNEPTVQTYDKLATRRT